MNKILCTVACAVVAGAVDAVAVRSGAADGDVSLQGPLAKTFEAMFKNHVLEQDPLSHGVLQGTHGDGALADRILGQVHAFRRAVLDDDEESRPQGTP